MSDDYLAYRGKCKEMAEAAIAADATLTLVRGHYLCPWWGPQQHWWATKPDGTVVDPSARQFPSKGTGEYVPFDGMFECEECGKRIAEDDAYIDPPHVFCSGECHAHHVGF